MKSLKPLDFDKLTNILDEEHRKNTEYVKKTGLCFVCKENKAEPGELRCKQCAQKINNTITELSKEKGFSEIKLPENFQREKEVI